MLTSLPLDSLPLNVLSLTGYDFFQFVKNTLGEPEANLLAKISVRTTCSFILIDDPLDIFNHDIDDDELDRLKEQLCFMTKNNKFFIKPGVLSGFRSLKEALMHKLNDQSVNSKKKCRRQHQQHQPNTSVLTTSSFLSAAQPTTTINSCSLTEHKDYVVKLIDKWCAENKENLDLETFDLEEGVDFTVNVELDNTSILHGSVKCRCGSLIVLGKNEQKLQLSNFYKHLQSSGCAMMRELRTGSSRLNQTEAPENETTTGPVITDPSPQSRTTTSTLSTREVATTSVASRVSSSSVSSQSNQSGKRRPTSQSQRQPSAKRIRR